MKKMKEIFQQKLTGERSEYFASDVKYRECVFSDGESPVKHGKNISAENCSFEYKYPFWNTENVTVKDSVFRELGKSGLWYTRNFKIENTVIEAPKEFRRSSGVFLKNVKFTNAAETLWNCSDIHLEKVQATGDYFAMNSSDFYADGFELEGNYFLEGGKNIEIHNARLNSKDAFWNCENVVVYDSEIIGEYLGWNSRNLKFVNCKIESDQGLCYIDGLVLENCTLNNSPLTFEYSRNIKAKIFGKIQSVKNPGSGEIQADEIETLILNPSRCDVDAVKIICPKIGRVFSEDPNSKENKY